MKGIARVNRIVNSTVTTGTRLTRQHTTNESARPRVCLVVGAGNATGHIIRYNHPFPSISCHFRKHCFARLDRIPDSSLVLTIPITSHRTSRRADIPVRVGNGLNKVQYVLQWDGLLQFQYSILV